MRIPLDLEISLERQSAARFYRAKNSDLKCISIDASPGDGQYAQVARQRLPANP